MDTSTNLSSPSNKKEKEFDHLILLRRQKQIDFFKNTVAYDNYVSKVPKDERPFYLPRFIWKSLPLKSEILFLRVTGFELPISFNGDKCSASVQTTYHLQDSY